MTLKGKKILLGITGGVAAYKAAELVRRMKERGWDVHVIMTEAATQFVGEVTFATLSQNPVGPQAVPKSHPVLLRSFTNTRCIGGTMPRPVSC